MRTSGLCSPVCMPPTPRRHAAAASRATDPRQATYDRAAPVAVGRRGSPGARGREVRRRALIALTFGLTGAIVFCAPVSAGATTAAPEPAPSAAQPQTGATPQTGTERSPP